VRADEDYDVGNRAWCRNPTHGLRGSVRGPAIGLGREDALEHQRLDGPGTDRDAHAAAHDLERGGLGEPDTPWLEAHGHAELLPDRVEMRVRKRRRSSNVECKATNLNGLTNEAINFQLCNRINA